MAGQIKVLIVGSQPRARSSLKALLATAPEVQEILEAKDDRETLGLVAERQPDVVLIDARVPEIDHWGLETTRSIKMRWPWIKVIILSLYTDYALLVLERGADAFVSKGEPPDKLLRTIVTFADGHGQDSASGKDLTAAQGKPKGRLSVL
jgi:DNA-binding NarL/FixJ family response regulator